MTDVVVEPKVFEKSKIHPTIIEQVRRRMMEISNPTRPKAKGQWLEPVRMDGTRFAVSCKKEQDKIVIIGIRYALRKKT